MKRFLSIIKKLRLSMSTKRLSVGNLLIESFRCVSSIIDRKAPKQHRRITNQTSLLTRSGTLKNLNSTMMCTSPTFQSLSFHLRNNEDEGQRSNGEESRPCPARPVQLKKKVRSAEVRRYS